MHKGNHSLWQHSETGLLQLVVGNPIDRALMAKLTSLKPQVGSLKSRLPTVVQVATQYGKGRGGRPWRRLREEVLKRDEYRCQSCGRITEDGECDHIVPIHLGGTDDLSNLQWLCKEPCHAEKTALEAANAQKAIR